MAQSELLVEVVRIQENPKIAEVTGDGWSFIRIPREEIENRKPLPLEKLKSSGIYFLNGIDWGAHCFKFCVGKAPRSDKLPFSEQGNECFLKRIDGVDLAQRWWENIFFLTSFPNGEFNDADLHYLEKRFRDQNEPTPGVHLGKGRESLDGIIREITLFMNIMGWNISNTPQSPPPPGSSTGNILEEEPPSQPITLPSPPNRNIFRLNDKTVQNYGVQARFEVPLIGLRKTIVLEGSVIASQRTAYPNYMNPKAKAAIQRWFTGHPGQCRLDEKMEFESPTAAVAFVTGHHMSGPAVMVRMTDRKTLAEITKTLRDAQKQAKGKGVSLVKPRRRGRMPRKKSFPA